MLTLPQLYKKGMLSEVDGLKQQFYFLNRKVHQSSLIP